MKVKHLLLVLIVFVLIISSCQQSNKNIIISEKEITLEPDSEKTIYVGINNINNQDKKFKISYDCSNCNDEISLQMFSEIGIKANKEGAFPIKIISNKDAKGDYDIKIKVDDIDGDYEIEKMKISVKDSEKEFSKQIIDKL